MSVELERALTAADPHAMLVGMACGVGADDEELPDV